jgi:hypothetical protein
MRALAGAPTLHAAVQEALTAATSQSSLNRGPGELFESELAARLTDDVQRDIYTEAVSKMKKVPGYGKVSAITWRWLGGGRKPADFLVTIEGSERTVVLPVNLKRTTDNYANWNAAVSTNALIRVACGLPLVSPQRLKRIPTDRTLLEFAAGVRALQPSDYFILDVSTTNDGNLLKVETQGLLSHVMDVDGKLCLAVRRQTGHQADLLYWRTQTIVPDGFDVNAAFIDAMLPTPLSADELALQNLALLRANGASLSSLRSSARAALK